MKVTYRGNSDHRLVSADDARAMGVEVDDDFVTLDWSPGQTLDIDDALGAELVERDRNMVNRSDTTRDLRSVEELQEVAKELGIKGRTKMNRDELLEVIVEEELRREEETLAGDATIDESGSGSSLPEEASGSTEP